jgi:hypothetical protein
MIAQESPILNKTPVITMFAKQITICDHVEGVAAGIMVPCWTILHILETRARE